MTAERPYKLFEGPNGTIPNLNLNQTYNLTLNHNFVVKNNKTEKKQCITVYQAQKLFSSSGISTSHK